MTTAAAPEGSGNRVNGIKKARTLKSEGWDNIVKEIKSTGEGSVIEITLNDETTMPEDAFQAAIDRKMKLIMDAGFGRIWEIDGAKADTRKVHRPQHFRR